MELAEQVIGGPEPEWQGSTPVFLVISLKAGGVRIDLDERQWATTYAGYMRVNGVWFLIDKLTKLPLLIMNVIDGEQPYYTARHFRTTGTAREIVAYGIGKKRLDGAVDRLWLLPNGLVCAGDDVDAIALRMLHSLR